MTRQPELSVCMIVKNEAHQLAAALSDCRSFADELVVVDTGSTDETRRVARQFTSKVFELNWEDDFSAARNHSLDRASGRYFLWLDADDRMTAPMQRRMNRLKNHFDGRHAFYLRLENVHEDRPATHCWQLRCLPLRNDIRFEGRIHEVLGPAVERAELQIVQTDIVIEHHGYQNPAQCRAKLQRNLALLTRQLEDRPDQVEPLFSLARTYDALGLAADALRTMERALWCMERGHFDCQTLIEGFLFLVHLYLDRGDRQRALRILVKADALAVGKAQHHFRMAGFYQRLNRHAEAVRCFRRIRDATSGPNLYPSPDLPPATEIVLLMAYSLLCLGQNAQAVKHLKDNGGFDPESAQCWEWLGLKAMREGRLPLAEQCYRRGAETGRMSAEGLCNLGTLLKREERVKKASECYLTALDVAPDHRDAQANPAHLYLSQGPLAPINRCLSNGKSRGAALGFARDADETVTPEIRWNTSNRVAGRADNWKQQPITVDGPGMIGN